MTLKSLFVLTLPLCLVVAFGCEKGVNSNSPATVSGKVTYKGEPVSGGTVTFTPKKEGPIPTATLSIDGIYTINDVPAGDFTVSIDNESLNSDHKTPQYPGSGGTAQPSSSIPANAPKPATPAGKYVKIPKKYADPKTSPLTATLGVGKQTKDFVLED